jgi:hypothetical protein
MFRFLGKLKTRTWLIVTAALALLERVLFYCLYRPATYNDTASYRRLAGEVLQGWSGYDGTRMPGYPVFLAALGPDERVYLAQLVLGLLTTLLFFYIGWKISGKGWFGGLAALAHTLNLQQLFFEADLLTETLTTFLLALSVAGMAWLLFSDGKRPLWQVLLAGLTIGFSAGLAVLVRTIFLFLPFLAAFLLLVLWRVRMRLRWGAALAAALAGLACLGVWLNFMHRTYHEWSLSTVDGYHLMNHAGVFFEYAPDEYAALRDTFLQYRDAQIAETGSSSNTIWNAIPALEKASGLGFFDLSRLLEKISVRLILDHPVLYLRNVLQGWIAFWKVPFHWTVNEGETPLQGMARRGAVLADRGALFLANLAFLCGSVLLVWKKARRLLKVDAFWWFILALVWLTSIIQTLLEYGDNPRYSVPVQTLVVLVVLGWGTQIIARLSRRNA